MRRSLLAVMAAALLVTSCSSSDSASDVDGPAPEGTVTGTIEPDGAAPVETEDAPAEPQVWAEAPTDGTWERSGTPLGQSRPLRDGPWPDEYTVTISDLPVLTLVDDPDDVTMTTTAAVERVADHDTGDAINESLRIHFIPGNYGYPQHDEGYGTWPTVECAPEEIQVGEISTCTFAFTAPKEEISNSYWWSDGRDMAAWPSQR